MNTATSKLMISVVRRLTVWLLLAQMPAGVWAASSQEPRPTLPGEALFRTVEVREIRLTISDDAFEKLRRAPRISVHAAMVDRAGWSGQVGLHLKGAKGSFQPVDRKPSFTIDFQQTDSSQRFHGLRKIHLNNSVEDPAYLNEFLGSELFRSAGLPAPRVGFAKVWLNDRLLGLYVLKEGFEPEFLAPFFPDVSGSLYEPGSGQDVTESLSRRWGPAQNSRAALKRLASATSEPDLVRRQTRLAAVLDWEGFIGFMAMELMVGHRDGYCLARNNFRLYFDPKEQRFHFIPQGMDQLFRNPKLSWNPGMVGTVAASVMQTERGLRDYRQRLALFLSGHLDPGVLAARVEAVARVLSPNLSSEEQGSFLEEVGELKKRFRERKIELIRQLEESSRPPLSFVSGRVRIEGWVQTDVPSRGLLDRVDLGSDRPRAGLRIRADEKTGASWRTRVRLSNGRYRFQASARTEGVKPLAFAKRQGAGIRIADGGVVGPERLLGNSGWTQLQLEFSVPSLQQEIELVCELIASGGEAVFDATSLELIKLE